MDRRDRLIQAGIELASQHELDVLLRDIVELAVELTDARFGALGVLGEDGRQLVDFITVGMTDDEVAAIGHQPVGRGLIGLLIEDPRPMRIERIADHAASAGFPSNHPPMTTMLGAPLLARGTALGNLYLTDKRGGAFTDEDEQVVVVLAAQAAVAIESARLLASQHQRAAMLAAAADVRDLVLAGADEQTVLQRLVVQARSLLDADLVAVLRPDGELLRVAGSVGTDAMADGTTVPLDGSASGAAISSGTPIAVGDLIREPAPSAVEERPSGMRSAAFTSLGADPRFVGVLATFRADGRRPFDHAEIQLLDAIAKGTGLVFAYAAARQAQERLAVLEDRERIAKDLHDGVIQSLFAVGMGLQGAAMATSDADTAARLDAAVSEIDHVVRDVRNYIFGLRPGLLADRQLADALAELGRSFEERSGVVTVIEVDRWVASELSSRAAEILQLARESLSNVERHAEATTCRLALWHEGERAVLEVDDDGNGFDPTSAARGLGLPNLEERARSLGGAMALDSAPGRGTVVRFELPLR